MRDQDCPEVWVAAHGFNGRYEVSSHGRVRSLLHPKGVPWKGGALILRVRVTAESRERVFLGRKDVHVPRLVLLSFVGDPPPGCECAHLDGDPRNNRLSNLAWVTHAVNMSHQVAHGTRRAGSRHAQAKLTDADVIQIRRRVGEGQTQRAVADAFGISQSLVSMLFRRTAWRHL